MDYFNCSINFPVTLAINPIAIFIERFKLLSRTNLKFWLMNRFLLRIRIYIFHICFFNHYSQSKKPILL